MLAKLGYSVATIAMIGGTLIGTAGAASAAHPEPTTKDDCKNGEFAEYNTNLTSGIQRFSNQGQCIKFVNGANKG